MTTAPTESTTGIWFFDALAHVHVSGDDTDGRMALVEVLAPQGHMPPLHVHNVEDETFALLEGEMTLYAGSEVHQLSAGDVAFGPRGVPHTFRVESPTARMLVAAAPAGFERFVATVGRPATRHGLPDGLVLPDPERFAEICREFDIEILGPPGTLPS